MGRLLNLLENYDVGNPNSEDVSVWMLNEEKSFSVKSMYDALRPQVLLVCPYKFIWNPLIPSRASFLIWELWWDRAPTTDNLIRRSMMITNWCCLCKSEGESVGHLFIHCPVVDALMLVRFGISWVQLKVLKCLFVCWSSQVSRDWSQVGVLMWQLILVAICWSIWEERNKRTFEGSSSPFQKIVDATLSKIYDWLSSSSNISVPSFKT